LKDPTPLIDTAARAADVALLVVYGGVAAFFIYRFVRHRRMASVGVALLPMGWIVVALYDLNLIADGSSFVRWCGVAVGLLVLTSVFRAEQVDPEGPSQ
jgi:hypothetical protein